MLRTKLDIAALVYMDRRFHRTGDSAEIIVLHRGFGNQREIIRRGIMIILRIAVRVGKMRARAAQLRRAFVHPAHEVIHRAGYDHRDGVRSIVAGIDAHAQQQIAERHRFAGVYGNQRTITGHIGGGLRNRNFAIHRNAALHRQQKRHDLRGARRMHPDLIILGEEHIARIGVDQYRGLAIQPICGQLAVIPGRLRGFDRLRRKRHGLRQRGGTQCRQGNQQNQNKRSKSALHGSILQNIGSCVQLKMFHARNIHAFTSTIIAFEGRFVQ